MARIVISDSLDGIDESKTSEVQRFSIWVRRHPPHCRWVIANVSIAITDCKKYQIGSVLTVTGSVTAPSTRSESGLKRLTVQDISSWRDSRHSVKRGLSSVLLTTGRWRTSLARQLQSTLSPSQSAIADSLLFGDNGRLPQALRNQINWAGLQHIIAASGFNVGLLAQLIRKTSGWLPRVLKVLVWLLVVGGYVLVAGASPSLVRAALMASLQWLGYLWRLPTHPLTALAISAGLMLLVYPWYIDSVSFQLSVLATLGIILFVPALEGLSQRWLLWETGVFTQHLPVAEQARPLSQVIASVIKETLVVTLAAQALVIPIIAWRFGQIAWLSPVTNVVVLWLVPIVTLAAGGWLVLATISSWLSALAGLVFTAGLGLAVLLEIFQALLAAVGSWPGSVQDWQAGWRQLLAWYGLVAVGYYWWRRQGKQPRFLEAWRER